MAATKTPQCLNYGTKEEVTYTKTMQVVEKMEVKGWRCEPENWLPLSGENQVDGAQKKR